MMGLLIEYIGVDEVVGGLWRQILYKYFSCEIEDFVATHLWKLLVILRSRVLRVVFPH